MDVYVQQTYNQHYHQSFQKFRTSKGLFIYGYFLIAYIHMM